MSAMLTLLSTCALAAESCVAQNKVGEHALYCGPWPYGSMVEVSDHGDWEGRGGSKGTLFLCQEGVEYQGKFIGAG